MIDFTEQVHIVSGGLRGIGRGIAEELGRRHARVVIIDPACDVHGGGESDMTAGEEVKQAIIASGGDVMLSTASVADFDAVGSLVSEVMERWGRLDGLAHIAGILRDGMLHKMPPADFDAVMKVHAYGGYNLLRHVLPIMRERLYGRILTSISTAGTKGNFGSGNYAGAKGALRAMFMTAGEEGADLNVLSNLLMPSAADTRMTAGFGSGAPIEPGRRAEDNASMAVFLLSRELGDFRSKPTKESPNGEPFTAQLVHKTKDGWRLMSAIEPVATIYADPATLTVEYIAENAAANFQPQLQEFGIPQLRAYRRAQAAKKAAAAKPAS